ncbi:MAG: glycosyltransferase [Candidatus Marinimicrobia bacterium]|nr:glycosyltransferase [Candidatus Neomarinimicrobiota bacterium]
MINNINIQKNNKERPLLSICIPTYNRASYLRSVLNSIVHQASRFLEKVEIIVSDNASEDNTKEVVEEYQGYFPIIYHRNDKNEGPARNVQILASRLSRGFFTWIIGDDDLVRSDGVERILKVIEDHQNVSFIFVNASPKSAEEYKSKLKNGIAYSEDFPDLNPTKSKYTEDMVFNSFEELIDPDIDEVFLGSLMCAVFKTDVWREYKKEIPFSKDLFDSLEGSYPHAFIFAQTMVGKKAYYLSYPVVIPFWGGQEWIDRIDILILVRLQELLDTYLASGFNQNRIDLCRHSLLERSKIFLESMLFNPKHIGLKYFSLEKFYKQNIVNTELFKNILFDLTMKANSRNINTPLLEETISFGKKHYDFHRMAVSTRVDIPNATFEDYFTEIDVEKKRSRPRLTDLKRRRLLKKYTYSEIYLADIGKKTYIYKIINKNKNMDFGKVEKSYYNLEKFSRPDYTVKVFDFRVNNNGGIFEVLMEYLEGFQNINNSYSGDRRIITRQVVNILNAFLDEKLIVVDAGTDNLMTDGKSVKLIDLDMIFSLEDMSRFNFDWAIKKFLEFAEWCPKERKVVYNYRDKLIKLKYETLHNANVRKLLLQGEKAFSEEGNLQKALELYTKAIIEDDQFAPAYNDLGIVYWKMDQYDVALKNFKRSIEIDNSNNLYVSNYASILALLGNLEEAISLLSNFIKNIGYDEGIQIQLKTLRSYRPERMTPETINEELDIERLQQEIDNYVYPSNYAYDIQTLEPKGALAKRVRYWQKYALVLFDKCENFLSVGSSLGYLLLYHSKTANICIGIEPDGKAIKLFNRVKNYHDIKNITVYKTTFKGFEKIGRYDLIWMGNVFHYMYLDYHWDVAKVLAEISTGYCVIEAPLEGEFLMAQSHLNNAWEDKQLMGQYTRENFVKEMSKYFEIISIAPSGTDPENRSLIVIKKKNNVNILSNITSGETKYIEKSSPFFTIIIPTYNQADYLRKALDSVLDQTFDDWEIVVVNDGSKDHTLDVMDEYSKKDNRIRCFHKENGGVSSALNEGIRQANGEWICWLSSDDLFEPDKLEIHYKAIRENPNIKFFHSHWYILLNETGKKISPGLWLPIPIPEFQVLSFFQANYIHGNAIAVHRSVFEKVGLFDERKRQGQDFDMWLRISAQYESKFINKRTCVTRIHADQDTNAFQAGGILDSSWACIEFVNEHNFKEIFPLFDLEKSKNILRAISVVLKIINMPTAFMYRGAFVPALADRLAEWVTVECPNVFKRKVVNYLLEVASDSHIEHIHPEIKRILQQLKKNITKKTEYRYKKYDYLKECAAYVLQLVDEGRQEKAYDIERFINRTYQFFNENSESQKSLYQPLLLNYPAGNKYCKLKNDSILDWDIQALDMKLNSVGHNLKIKCRKCGNIFNFSSDFANINSPQSKKFICPACKTGYELCDGDLYKYLIQVNKNIKSELNRNKRSKPCMAFLIRSANIIGGGTKIIYKHIKWLDKLGCEIVIYSLSPPPSWIKLPGKFVIINSLKEIDITYVDFIVSFSIFDIPALMHIFPVDMIVHFCQGYEGYHYGNSFEEARSDKYIFTMLHSLPTRTIVVSKHLLDLFQSKFNKASYYIPNGIDHSTFYPKSSINKIKKSILFIGNPYHPLKGFLFLAETIKRIQNSENKIHNLKLYVISNLENSIERDNIKHLEEQIGAEITSLNNLTSTQVALFINKVELLVSTSWYEGFSLPPLEAMSCGTPVIITNNMGSNSFYEDGYNSFVFPFGDFDMLQERIFNVLNKNIETEELIINGLKTSLQYDELNTLNQFIVVYSDLLDEKFMPKQIKDLQKDYQNSFESFEEILIEYKRKYRQKTAPIGKKVTIIILTYNALEYTKQCIQSIQEHTNYPYEIIFVDNHSTDGTKRYLRQLVSKYPNYKLIANKQNKGFAAGNNQGMKSAKGEYILLLNNDVLVSDGWLERMVACAEADNSIGIVGPITNWISGLQKVKDVPYDDPKDFSDYAARIAKQYNKKYTPRRRIAGFAMLIKRDVYEKIGGLDEQFGSGNYEDDDYCLRAKEAGFTIMVAEDVFIHHFGSKSFKCNNIDYDKSLKRNRELFKKKWPEVDLESLLEKKKRLTEISIDLVINASNHLKSGEVVEASKMFNEVLKTNPINQDALLGFALCAHQKNDNETALKHLNKLLELNPNHAGVYNLYGIISFESGNLENAKKLFAIAIKKDTKFINAQRNYGEVLLALKEYDNGVKTLMAILKDHPNDVPTLLNVSHLYLEVGKNGEAIAYLEKANRLEPDNRKVIDMLKIVSEGKDSNRSNSQPEMQRDQVEKAEDSRLTHASSLLIEGEIEAAKVLYAEVLSEDSRSEGALFGLALCARQQQDNESALRHLNQLIKINPNCADAYNQSGLISFETWDLESSKTLFIAAIEKDPKFIEAQRNYGEVLLALEDYENGVNTFVEILKNHPGDLPTLIRMAQIHAEVGKNNEARNYASKILEYDSENRLAKEILNS